MAAVGALLDRFNREFDTPTPGPEAVAERMRELIAGGDTAAIVAGEGPNGIEGICVVRFQPSIWSRSDEAYIAEFYVAGESRRRGLGSAIMTVTLDLCRERGCEYVFLGTDEYDADAHRLYERFGFSNLSEPEAGPEDRERMFVYELLF